MDWYNLVFNKYLLRSKIIQTFHRNPRDFVTKAIYSKLILVDLAGSERAAVT